jgi:hypothetical protein
MKRPKIFQRWNIPGIMVVAILAWLVLPGTALGLNQAWVQFFDDHNLTGDRAVAVATDKAGNIYVTGKGYRTTGPTTRYEYVTIKYSPGGALLWQTPARYNNNNDTFDHEPIAIAVDQNTGDVYVTGTSNKDGIHASTACYIWTTVKYDTNGNQKWVRTYTYSNDANDRPYAMCLDSAGNVYVTGTVWGLTGFSSNKDYYTISYDPNGNTRWGKTYRDGLPNLAHNGTPTAIVVDKNDNIIVTGWSNGDTSEDFATIKYDKNGNVVWTLPYGAARYDGPAHNGDKPAAIAVDDLGNIYVTGLSYNSNTTWDTSYATVKYDPNGTQLGATRYNGAGVESYPTAIKVDAGGNNIVVTGTSKRPGASDYDIVTIAYTDISQQEPQKEWRYAGVLDSNGNPINTVQKPVALAIKRWGPGGGGNGQPEGYPEKIFVTGTVGSSGTDIVTLVYDPWGAARPPLHLGGEKEKIIYPGVPARVEPVAMVLDPKGNVVITGYTSDFLTIKYNLVRQSALTWLPLLLH